MVKRLKREVASVNIRLYPSTHALLREMTFKSKRSIAVTVDELAKSFAEKLS